jgi:uncharacterized protein (DUF1330 family)
MKTPLPIAVAVASGLLAAPHQQQPAPVYLVSHAEEITDTAMVREYGKSVGKTIKDFGGTVLVGAAPAVELDGQAPPKGRFVIVRFPSMDALQQWYNSPAYTAIRPLREKATVGRFYALQGIPTP